MGTLPFISSASLKQGDTEVLADMPISVWPVMGVSGGTGTYYDHQAEAPVDYADLLRGTSNLRLFVNGIRYTIVGIESNLYWPHVSLLLREATSAL